MKHKRKRLLCILAALTVTAGPVQELRLPAMLPAVSAEAAEPEETVTRSGITYAVYADHAEVTKLAPNVIDANIEAEVSGKPVTVIQEECARNHVNLQSLTVPDSVTDINSNAFYSCEKLKSVTLGKGLKNLNSFAFWFCSLTSITIPASVNWIGPGALGRNIPLSSIKVDPENQSYTVQDGVLYSKDLTRLHQVPCMFSGELNVPDSVERILDNAASLIPNLTAVNFGEQSKLKIIGKSVFWRDQQLKEFHMPDTVTECGGFIFYDCTALETVHLSENLTEIPEWLFNDCNSLKELTVPASVGKIGKESLDGASALSKLTVLNPACEFDASVFGESVPFTGTIVGYDDSTAKAFAAENGYPFESLGSAYDPDKLEDGECFSYSVSGMTFEVYNDHAVLIGVSDSLTDLNVPETVLGKPVTEIADEAASRHYQLVSVTLPDSLTEIGIEAFAHCPSLKSVDLGKGVTDVDMSAFCDCSLTGTVQIPASVTYIGSGVFQANPGLKEIRVDSENPAFTAVNGILYSKDMTVLYQIPGAWSGEYQMPDTVERVIKNACSYCDQVTAVRFGPDSALKYIGDLAFSCMNIETFDMPDTVTNVGAWAFDWCHALKSVRLSEKLSGVTKFMFRACDGLSDLVLPESAASGAYYALAQTDALQTLVVMNPAFVFDDSFFGNPDDSVFIGTIYGYSGSTAETFAEQHDYPFIALDTLEKIVLDGVIYTIDAEKGEAYVSGHKDGITEANIRKTVIGFPVVKIGDGAFLECTTLQTLTMPEGIREIEEMAFRECTGLEGTIRIPDSVERIGLNAFQSCSKVVGFDFGADADPHLNPDAKLKEIGFGAFEYCYALKEVYLPDSIRKIGGSAFQNCSAMTYISCGQRCEFIDNYAFSGCKKLALINIGMFVSKIGEGAFNNCSSLLYLFLPDTVDTIGRYACSGVTSLPDIYFYCADADIADYVTTFTNKTSPDRYTGTFHGYSNSTAQAYAEKYGINFVLLDDDGDEEIIRSGIHYKIYEDYAEVIGCDNEVTEAFILPKVKGKPVRSIRSSAFVSNMKITAASIPGSVQKIGRMAFYACENLKALELNEGLETVDQCAFYVTGITELTLPDSVTAIGEKAFAYCPAMRSVSVGKGVRTIEDGAFSGTDSLNTITVSDKNDAFKVKDGMLYTADETRIVATPCTVTEYEIPDGVTKIDYAFEFRHNLQKVTVPASVSDMNHAFNSCDKLTDVTLSDGLKELSNYAFTNCTALDSVTLPESLEVLGYAAFAGCDSLRELVLPKSVTKADESALGKCLKIARVTFYNPECEISDDLFKPMTEDPLYKFKGVIVGYDDSTAEKFANDHSYTFESLGKIFGYLVYKKYEDHIEIVGHTDELPADAEIPDSIEELPVTVIAERAFKKSTVLETIKLPDTLIQIGDFAFLECTNLKEITFSASVKRIGYGAFGNCSAITELVIPDTVEYVDEYAFKYCTQLKKLTLGAETVDDYCFRYCTALEDVTITDSVKTIVGAFVNCDSLKELVIPDTVDSAFCPVCDCSALEKLTIGARQLGGTSNEYYIVNELPAMKELILTDHVEELNVGMKNVNISTLEIPASVKTINAVICYFCDNLMTDGSLIIRSKDCEFAEKALFDDFGNKFGGTVYGYPGSTAETYCKDNEIKFVPICNVTFDANGAEGSMEGGEFFGEITLPENAFTVPEGKVFTGWLLTGDDTLHAAGETVTLTDDTVITAQWETLTYTVKFNANGGTGTMSPLTVEYGAKVTLPVCSFTAPEGKQFSGWQIGTKTYQPGKEITVKADKTVKALWEDEVIFTLTFNPNGSTGTMDPITVKQGESLTLPDLGFLVPANMQFSRWMVDGNLYVPGSEITLTADAEAIPVWEPIPFTVMFDANGGTGTMGDVTVAGGSSFTLPECGFTAPSGKQFAGWQIKDDVSMTYQPAQTLTVTADLTLIPVWKDSEEKLMGDVNGDGLVDSADAMLVSRYVNAWPDIVIDMQTADLDGSGTVDNADAMILARYVNGWTGYDSYIVTVSG